MKPLGTHSGAQVTSVTPRLLAVSMARSSSSGRAEAARIVHARLARATRTVPRDECRERPAMLASRLHRPRDGAGVIFSAVSVIKVGSSAVVPNLRCAETIAEIRFRRRIIVEQHVAAAIDLHVDETGSEPQAVRQRANRQRSSARRRAAATPTISSFHRSGPRCRDATPTPSNTWRLLWRCGRRSSGPRHLLQMARLIDVGSAPFG